MRSLRASFTIADAAEVSIEVDPRTAGSVAPASPVDLGFNRLSFGYRTSIRPCRPRAPLSRVWTAAFAAGSCPRPGTSVHQRGPESYGFPSRRPESFARTVAQVANSG